MVAMWEDEEAQKKYEEEKKREETAVAAGNQPSADAIPPIAKDPRQDRENHHDETIPKPEEHQKF